MDTVAAKLQALAHTPDYDTSHVSLSAWRWVCGWILFFSDNFSFNGIFSDYAK